MWRWTFLAAVALAAFPAQAERFQYRVGGRGGAGWAELAHQATALDDTSFPGSLQPKELKPWENVIAGPERTNIFGMQWYPGKWGFEAFGLELGLNPRFWEGTGGGPAPEIIDGDTTTFLPLRLLVPGEEISQHLTGPASAWEQGVFDFKTQGFTFDLGIETPLNRIAFFPPQQGIDRRGIPNKEGAPQGFAVSVARTPQDFLLLGSESLPLRTLETLVERTLANSRSIVELPFPLQPVRFVRLDLSLMPQVYSLAEFQAFGEGVPPRATFASLAIDFGEPVNFGRVDYAFGKWRRQAGGELVEDPEGGARLVLETRTGTDDSPLAYLVVDDFGGTREVSKAEYERAALPRRESTQIRYPGQRDAIAEDREHWSPWSSPYERSGLANRSPDGRQYLQFRVAVETEDILSIGRLDSLVFEYSPLLVAGVVGEVSLGDGAGSGAEERPAEVRAGERHLFLYDIAASFEAPAQRGFDGVRLDVPRDTRLVRLEMGEPLAEVVPDSARLGDDELEVFFSSHRIAADNNQPVRLTLETAVLNSSTFFTGEVFDAQSDNLPQSIEPGNARDQAPTNSLQVFALQEHLRFLEGVELVPPVLTPNGDGVNEGTAIVFDVLFVEAAQVTVDIFDLRGRRFRRLLSQVRGPGHYLEQWDGRDELGKPAAPGLYLCRIEVKTQRAQAQVLKAIPVAY